MPNSRLAQALELGIDRYRDQQRAFRWLLSLLLLGGVAAVYALVFYTGGVKFVYAHSMYIPIVLAGFLFGLQGGLLIALIGGLSLGPIMPLDVVTGEEQKTINWLYRCFFFALIGTLSGAVTDLSHLYIKRLQWAANHDPNSRRPNRRALLRYLRRLAEHNPTSRRNSLGLISLENPLEITSHFGAEAHDSAMQQLAGRLESSFANAPVFHVDSTKLALVLPQSNWDEKSRHTLTELCRDAIEFAGLRIHIDIRSGLVEALDLRDKPEQHLQKAELALSMASHRALEQIRYRPELGNTAKHNLEILGELKQGLSAGDLQLHYQAKIDAQQGRLCSAEALLRWNHPSRGMISPQRFIPRAERSTLIQPITRFALAEAIMAASRWKESLPGTTIAVNVSANNLLEPDFYDAIVQLLDHHEVEAQAIELELTESALSGDVSASIQMLKRLRTLGLNIAIDDFGTGYASLQYLYQLPASSIKIDQSFIRKLPSDQHAANIVETTVALAHKLGMKTIAEGVDNPQAQQFLRQIGCDMLQGFGIAPPMPEAEFLHWARMQPS